MIKVNQLSKHFGAKKAVDKISFEVRVGQVMGLLGPNGAGKSTTMKMATGCLRPTAGTVTFDGCDVWKKPLQAKAILGFLPESAPSYDDLTVTEFLDYLASIRGLRGKNKTNAIERSLELCYLDGVRHQSVDTLSKGYRHRICLAQSILHDPKVIVFDEPTDGLDPNQKREIQNLVTEIKKDKAIILSTHILDEVDTVCTDLVLLNQGTIIREGTPATLREESSQRRHLELEATGDGVEKELLKIAGVRAVLENEAPRFLIETSADSEADRQALAEEVHALAVTKNWKVRRLAFCQGSLEEVFRKLTFTDN